MKQLAVFVLLAMSHYASAQSTCQAVITGNVIMCINDTITLSAGSNFDTYQWYKKIFTDANPPQAIAGATASTIDVNWFDDSAFEYSVVVTSGNCVDTSAAVLVDSWAFTSITVASSGTFDIDPSNGDYLICPGDKVIFSLLSPYDTNIQWTNNGVNIPNATSVTYLADVPGAYHVSAAPSVCPNAIENLGVIMYVRLKSNCPALGNNEPDLSALNISISPNPSNGQITIDAPSATLSQVRVFDNLGRLVFNQNFMPNSGLDLSMLGSGLYLVQVENDGKVYTQKMILK